MTRPPGRLALLVLLAISPLVPAADDKKSPTDDYPLKTCVVSNETLSADVVTYTHKEPGKPDVTFRLCCESCIEELRQDPAKFRKKLEDARAAQQPPSAPKKK